MVFSLTGSGFSRAALLLTFCASLALEASAAVSVIPQPREVVERGGTCLVKADFFDIAATNWTVDATLPSEGYQIEVTPAGVSIRAADAAGAFYAVETLRQLAPTNEQGFTHRRIAELRRLVRADLPVNEVVAKNPDVMRLVSDIRGTYEKGWVLPCVTIRDWPQYRWRALMLDEGRHFFGKEAVLDTLAAMAAHKLNVFHWHLTEDQGWRLDIPGLPELVKYGAVRRGSVAYRTGVHYPRGFDGGAAYELSDQPYGPFYYTPADIAEVCARAKELHIRIVPEIEFPGHARALLAAHPEFSCVGATLPRFPRVEQGVEKEVICAANEEAVRYLERVLDGVIALFPDSDIIHIGGDECFCERWKSCPKCQALKAREGYATERDLQSRLTLHFADYLKARGRKIMGWDGLLTGKPLDVETTLVHYRKPRPGCRAKTAGEAAALGHDIVLIKTGYAYFNLDQGLDEDPYYYRAWSDRVTLRDVYAANVAEGVAEKDLRHVLGAEGLLWTEEVYDRRDMEWKLWPRAMALAEVLWTGEDRPDYGDFVRRLVPHRRRLVKDGLNCAPVN